MYLGILGGTNENPSLFPLIFLGLRNLFIWAIQKDCKSGKKFNDLNYEVTIPLAFIKSIRMISATNFLFGCLERPSLMEPLLPGTYLDLSLEIISSVYLGEKYLHILTSVCHSYQLLVSSLITVSPVITFPTIRSILPWSYPPLIISASKAWYLIGRYLFVIVSSTPVINLR